MLYYLENKPKINFPFNTIQPLINFAAQRGHKDYCIPIRMPQLSYSPKGRASTSTSCQFSTRTLIIILANV